MKTNIFKGASRYIVLALFAPVFTGNTFAQNIKLEKETGYFNAIEISDNIGINISQGDKPMVILEGEEDAVNAFVPNIKNNILKIKAGQQTEELESIHIVVKDLKDICMKGASSLKGTSVIKTKNLTLTAEDASEIKLDLDVDSLKTIVEGAASIKYSGKATNHKIQIKGAASISAYALETENSQIDLAGAGTAQVNVKNELSGEISGLGSIVYKDEPAKVNVKTSGLGSVKKGSPKTAKLDSESDTTKFNIGQKEVQIFDKKDNDDKKKKKKDKFNGHWGGIEIGLNNYLNRYNKMEVPGGYDFLDLKTSKSIGVGLNIYEQNFNLCKNHLGIVSGVGLTYNNYRFTQNTTLLSKSPVVAAFTDTTRNFLKNKLTVSYLTVPVILEYNTGKKHKFHVGAGMILGARLGSHIKQVYEVDGSKYKDKAYDDFNLFPYKADATVRIGWGFVNLFANYSLTPLFKQGKQPELYPFTVGLCVVGW